MRKLTATLVLGLAAAPFVLSGSAAALVLPPRCPPPQPTYLPDQTEVTLNDAVNATTARSGLGTISRDGYVRVSFISATCGGFRLVLHAREIRPGNLGYPTHDGYTTLANVLRGIPSGPVTIRFRLTVRGRALLKYARANGQSLTVFVIVHVRPVGTVVSAESLRIVRVR